MIPGVGPQLTDTGVRGWLALEYLPDDLQRLEDARQVADWDRWNTPNLGNFTYRDGHKFFERPATAVERALLGEHLGYELPDELTTRVEWVNDIVRRRTWPELESETT